MKCYICGYERGTEVLHDRDYGDKELVSCLRCGEYEITGTVKATLAQSEANLQLSAYLRDWKILTGRPASLNTVNLESITQNLPHFSVSEKQRRLLGSLAAISDYPGHQLRLNAEADMVLAWANSGEEFTFYLDALIDRRLLTQIGHKTLDGAPPLVTLSPSGWDAIELDATTSPSSEQVFVAMSFSNIMLPIYNAAIRPTIEAVGYMPYRVDHEQHLDRIDAKIIAAIKKSKFLVADVTEQKAGVYYEAGYAHGLGIPVVWTVQADDLEGVHFDTRQYNHIVWNDAEHLSEQLGNFIVGFFGTGPRRLES